MGIKCNAKLLKYTLNKLITTSSGKENPIKYNNII